MTSSRGVILRKEGVLQPILPARSTSKFRVPGLNKSRPARLLFHGLNKSNQNLRHDWPESKMKSFEQVLRKIAHARAYYNNEHSPVDHFRLSSMMSCDIITHIVIMQPNSMSIFIPLGN